MKRNANAGTDRRNEQRAFGIAVMLCGLLILLDLFLIASLSVRGGMAP